MQKKNLKKITKKKAPNWTHKKKPMFQIVTVIQNTQTKNNIVINCNRWDNKQTKKTK